ncbi:MAG: Probable signal peptide protein, partial [uncultured Nocardioides sp.]
EAHHRPGPRRVRGVVQLERRHRLPARRRLPGGRRSQPAARHRVRLRCALRPRPQHQRPGRPGRTLLRRRGDHQRRPRGGRRAGPRLRRRVRLRRRRERRRPVGQGAGRHPWPHPAVRRPRRGWPGHVHRPGQVPPAVLRRPAGGAGPADGRRAAAVHRGGAQRPLRRRPAVEGHPELVHLRRARPQHPGRVARVHGRAGRLAAHAGRHRGLPRRRHDAPRGDGGDDPRGRPVHRARRRL